MKKTLQLTAMGLLLVGLAGCDAAEQSAQKLAEKAEQAMQDVARETVDGTLQQLNKQLNEVQQSTNEWLGKPPSKETQEGELQEGLQETNESGEPIEKTAVET